MGGVGEIRSGRNRDQRVIQVSPPPRISVGRGMASGVLADGGALGNAICFAGCRVDELVLGDVPFEADAGAFEGLSEFAADELVFLSLVSFEQDGAVCMSPMEAQQPAGTHPARDPAAHAGHGRVSGWSLRVDSGRRSVAAHRWNEMGESAVHGHGSSA